MIYFLTVNFYSANLVTQFINSLPTKPNNNYKIIIINNSIDDDSIYKLKNQLTVIIDAETNLGFGGACNLGLQWIYKQDNQAKVWIINPDAYLPENTVEKAKIFLALHSELSIIGTIIHTPENKIWFAGGLFIPQTGAILQQDLLKNLDASYINCDWVSGCSMIINFPKFLECPLFDQAYFLYYEDFDFCRRYAHKGHLIAVTKRISVIHQPSSITNRNVFKKIRYSTYSYLFTMKRYTNKLIFDIRLIQQIFKAIIALLLKPQAALGKFYGIYDYIRNNQRN